MIVQGIHQFFQHLYKECIYIVWPHLCACCKQFLRDDTLLCIHCTHAIETIASVPLAITAKRCMQVYAVAAYTQTIKRLILAKGWADQRASVVLGRLMWQRAPLHHIAFDVIIPIPLHWTRFAYRGYNQAELMARQVSQLSGKPLYTVLRRIKRTTVQSKLSQQQRKANLQGAFKLDKQIATLLRGKRVLLVDDLMTSGATLQDAAKCINRCKPVSIAAVVAGRVV